MHVIKCPLENCTYETPDANITMSTLMQVFQNEGLQRWIRGRGMGETAARPNSLVCKKNVQNNCISYDLCGQWLHFRCSRLSSAQIVSLS